MDRLAHIVRQFDIVAIQEIARKARMYCRDSSTCSTRAAGGTTTSSANDWGAVSREQYAFVFDTERVEVDRNQCYVIHDPADVLRREPHVGWFRVRGSAPPRAWTFSLVNLHTDPDEVDQEMQLPGGDLRGGARRRPQRGRRVIILGDFNIDDAAWSRPDKAST